MNTNGVPFICAFICLVVFTIVVIDTLEQVKALREEVRQLIELQSMQNEALLDKSH